MAEFSETLLARIEDASLNASAPPQQRWLDGWLVRFSPGKAKRARCINAVAAGRLPLAQKLALCTDVYRGAGLPLLLRITRFTQPSDLDATLAAQGWTVLDDTRVLVCPQRPAEPPSAPPPGLHWQVLDAARYAEAVGALRGSPPEQRQAHAQRLALSPVPYRGIALVDAQGEVQACGQFAREAELVGLYDVFTRDSARGRGLAALLCRHLLALAAAEGAQVAYLQVEHDNHVARRLYECLGFAEGYRYHYRQLPAH